MSSSEQCMKPIVSVAVVLSALYRLMAVNWSQSVLMWANCNHKEHNWATYCQHSHLWERKTVFLSTPSPLPSSSSQRLTCDSATCVFYSRLAAARGQRAAEMPGCLYILPVSRCKRMKERMVFIHLYWEAGKQWRAGSGGGGQAGGEGWQTKRRSREDKRSVWGGVGGHLCNWLC